MSSQLPPDPPYFPGYIFNPTEFIDETITGSVASNLYLKKSGDIASGYMTWSDGFDSNNISTFNDDIVLSKNPVASINATNELHINSGAINDLDITSGGILTLSSNQSFMNTYQFVNQGSYNQSIERNNTNPSNIRTSTELMVCSTIGNQLTMLPYTNYYPTGFMFKVCNITNSIITMTSPDIDFNSWLRGNVGLVYDIQPNSSITCYLLAPSITLSVAQWFVRDDFGYKTINTNANLNHYLNFSDASTSGVGNIQKTAGIYCNPSLNFIYATAFVGSCTQMITTSDNTNGNYYIPFSKTTASTVTPFYLDDTTTALTYNPSTSTLSATTFNGSSTGILTTSDNTATTCYIPFSKTTAGTNTSLFLDDTTGPLTYTPSTGTLTFLIGQCARYDGASTGAAATIFNNTTTGNTTYSNSATTGSISIGSTAMTTGNINIGTSGATGVVNIRPVLTLSNVVRTNNTTSPSNDLDLGKSLTYFGSNFINTNLIANIVANVLSESFSSSRFGTYLVTANVIINPTNTTAIRTCQISLSTTVNTIQTPYFVRTYSQVGGNVETLFITRVVPIYAATTITLTALCDTNATIANGVNDNLLTFTRIA